MVISSGHEQQLCSADILPYQREWMQLIATSVEYEKMEIIVQLRLIGHGCSNCESSTGEMLVTLNIIPAERSVGVTYLMNLLCCRDQSQLWEAWCPGFVFHGCRRTSWFNGDDGFVDAKACRDVAEEIDTERHAIILTLVSSLTSLVDTSHFFETLKYCLSS
ncbi:hypothetical protein C5167_018086 [Papaver somniferum]|uniref:Uncharacterized protein n=1 Tax=Papaver somniferum TaxID=3469 RepID=A0A4Y7ILR3_PAPSO|nr:hypothetical protein C5167_018086 [Papaver somniferum]